MRRVYAILVASEMPFSVPLILGASENLYFNTFEDAMELALEIAIFTFEVATIGGVHDYKIAISGEC